MGEKGEWANGWVRRRVGEWVGEGESGRVGEWENEWVSEWVGRGEWVDVDLSCFSWFDLNVHILTFSQGYGCDAREDSIR